MCLDRLGQHLRRQLIGMQLGRRLRPGKEDLSVPDVERNRRELTGLADATAGAALAAPFAAAPGRLNQFVSLDDSTGSGGMTEREVVT